MEQYFVTVACPCRPSIDKILKMLPPKEQRQTVLFSATYPSDIKALSRSALRPNYELVDTVGETEVQTAERVETFSPPSPKKPQESVAAAMVTCVS